MEKLFIEKNGKGVPVAELAIISAKEQLVLGNAERDLVLRTAGNVKIQVGNKFYDLPLTESTDGTSVTIGGNTTVLNSDSDLVNLTYPGDGGLVYVIESKSFYIAINGGYQLINSLGSSPTQKLYLSYQEDQSLTGLEKYRVLLNAGYLIDSLDYLDAFINTNTIYPGQVIYSIADQGHYRLADASQPSLKASWTPLYITTKDGGVTNGPVTITNEGGAIKDNLLHLIGYYNTALFDKSAGYTNSLVFAPEDYSKGYASWYNQQGDVFFQALTQSSSNGFKFISNSLPILTLTSQASSIYGVPNYNYGLTVNKSTLLNATGYTNYGWRSPQFNTGINGDGFSLERDLSGDWTLEVDKLIVRKQAKDNKVSYESKSVNGSLWSPSAIQLDSVDLVEEIEVYVIPSAIGSYTLVGGNYVEIPLVNKLSYANVERVVEGEDDEEDTTITELIELQYGLGDRDSTGTLYSGPQTYVLDDEGNYVTIPATHYYDSASSSWIEDSTLGTHVLSRVIYVYNVTSNADDRIQVGDLLIHSTWDGEEYPVTYILANVDSITEGINLWVWNGELANDTTLIPVGNMNTPKGSIQYNGIDKRSDFIQVYENIPSFREMFENIHFTNADIDGRVIANNFVFKADAVVTIGHLIDQYDTRLGYTTPQYGFYTTNGYFRGNVDINKAIFGTQLNFENDVLTIVDLEIIKSRNITGVNGLTGGGNLFVSDIQISHGAKNWANKTDLTGNNVISNLVVDAYGHPTDWVTRQLTTTDIPEGTNLYYTNARVQAFGDTRWASIGSLADVHIAIANAAGVEQFDVYNNQALRLEGAGDTSISFDAATNKVIISSTGGSSGETGVVSFNGRTGAVSSQAGDYTTAQVTEFTNLYFTNARVQTFADTRYSLLGHTHIWADITNRPTALSQFTNDLGNYGGWALTDGSNAVGTWNINIDGNALNATTAVNWSGYEGTELENITGYIMGYDSTLGKWRPSTSSKVREFLGLGSFAYRNSIDGNEVGTHESNTSADIRVAKMLRWKNYGNGHVIFDASNGTAPDGSGHDRTNSEQAWTPSYPTLMGWNGGGTFGVRVDSARTADYLGNYNWNPQIVSNFDYMLVRNGANEINLFDAGALGPKLGLGASAYTAETLDSVATRDANLYRTIHLRSSASVHYWNENNTLTGRADMRDDVLHQFVQRASDNAALPWRENWWDGGKYHSMYASGEGFTYGSKILALGGSNGAETYNGGIEVRGTNAGITFHYPGYVASNLYVNQGNTLHWTGGGFHGSNFVQANRLIAGYDSGQDWSVNTASNFRVAGNGGIAWDTYAIALEGIAAGDFKFSTNAGGIALQLWASGNLKSYIYSDAGGNFGFLNASGGWALRIQNSGGDVHASTYHATNWFRSGGDSGWYSTDYGGGIHMTDPTWVRVYNSKNFLVDAQCRANDFNAQGVGYYAGNFGIGLIGAYSAERYQSVFSMGHDYRPALDGTSLENSYGIVWTHSNVGGQSKYGLEHQALFTMAGITQTAIGKGIWTIADIYAQGNIRAASNDGGATTVVRNSDLANYVTTNTSQSGLAGTKNWTGSHTYTGSGYTSGIGPGGVYASQGSNTYELRPSDLLIRKAGYLSQLLPPVTITGDRLWTLPDKSGTFAMLSDIVSPTISLDSGTYTPTITSSNNISGTPGASIHHYIRVGDQVMVQGVLNYSTASSGSSSSLTITLPITSNLVSSFDLSGSGSIGSTATDLANVRVLADTSNDRAVILITSVTVGAAINVHYSFTYTIK